MRWSATANASWQLAATAISRSPSTLIRSWTNSRRFCRGSRFSISEWVFSAAPARPPERRGAARGGGGRAGGGGAGGGGAGGGGGGGGGGGARGAGAGGGGGWGSRPV